MMVKTNFRVSLVITVVMVLAAPSTGCDRGSTGGATEDAHSEPDRSSGAEDTAADDVPGADTAADIGTDAGTDVALDVVVPPQRIIAIGDLHADLATAYAVLEMAGVIDGNGAWVAGETIVVQTGDVTDRGPHDREVIDFLQALRVQAEAAGGALVLLLGNHEMMNVEGDFRYVSEDSCAAFDDIDDGLLDLAHPSLLELTPACQKRGAAFLPGAPYAQILAGTQVTAIVGRTVFAHGGILPKHVEAGLDSINQLASAWMMGQGAEPAMAAMGSDSITWLRIYSDGEVSDEDCATLRGVLTALDADRLVVGHTVQDNINSDCDGKVWRIDVGIADYYGSTLEALEIVGDTVTVLSLY